MLGDGLHLDAVGEHDAVKADVPAQDAGENLRGHGRGDARLDLREEDVRGHDGPGGLLPAERAIGRQARGLQLLARHVHGGEEVVRIGRAAAVAGEVLEAGHHPGGLHAPAEGRGMADDALRHVAEGAHADDRAGDGADDVHHRREVELEARGGELLAHGAADGAGEFLVIRGAERQVGGKPRQVLRKAHDAAALVVDAQQRRNVRAAAPDLGGEGVIESARVAQPLNVVAKVYDVAHAVIAQRAHGGLVQLAPVQAIEHQLADLLTEGKFHKKHPFRRSV